jgi:exonuclease III
MVKIITWNIARRADAWRWLVESDADIALLQEAKKPPADIAAAISVDAAAWQTGSHRLWRAAVVKLSNRAHVEWLDAKPLADAQWGELGVSRLGTLAAATVTPASGEPFIAVSVYAPWESPHSMTKGDFIYADASVHRLISDLSVFASKQSRQNILVAGDLNVLYGHGEHGMAKKGAASSGFSCLTAR